MRRSKNIRNPDVKRTRSREILYVVPPRQYCRKVLGNSDDFLKVAKTLGVKVDKKLYNKQRKTVENLFTNVCTVPDSMVRSLNGLAGGSVVYDKYDRPVRLGLRGGAGRVRWVLDGKEVPPGTQGATRQTWLANQYVDDPEEPEPKPEPNLGIFQKFVMTKAEETDAKGFVLSKDAKKRLNKCDAIDDQAEKESCWATACNTAYPGGTDDARKCLAKKKQLANAVGGVAEGIFAALAAKIDILVANASTSLEQESKKSEDWLRPWIINSTTGALVGGALAVATGGAALPFIAAGAAASGTVGGPLKAAKIGLKYGFHYTLSITQYIVKHPIAAQLTFLMIRKFIDYGCRKFRNYLLKNEFLRTNTSLVPNQSETVEHRGAFVAKYDTEDAKWRRFDKDYFQFAASSALDASAKHISKFGFQAAGQMLGSAMKAIPYVGGMAASVTEIASIAMGEAAAEYMELNIYAKNVGKGYQYLGMVVTAAFTCVDFNRNLTSGGKTAKWKERLEKGNAGSNFAQGGYDGGPGGPERAEIVRRIEAERNWGEWTQDTFRKITLN